MIAAIYARKSTDQAVVDEAKSVARQIDHARQYARAKGWNLADEHVYVDDGISGAEFATRPGFLRLMNALKPRPSFNVLIMSEESRLGREAIETAYALKQLVTAGVRVFFYLEDRERTLDSPTDKIMMSLTAFADELEREKARQRTYDAMQRKARASHVTGGAVFGYRNVEVLGADGRRSHVNRVIDDDQAAVVREIFTLCARGIGKVAIAKALNAEGAPTPRAQQGRPKSWAPSSVRAILYRDLYRGEIVWNRSRKRDTWGVKRQRQRPESEWMRVPAPQLRIVSDDLWTAAHARLDATRQTYLRHNDGRVWGRPKSGLAGKYLLTGMARCGVCGAGLEVRPRSRGPRRTFYYQCSSYYRRGAAVCPNRYTIDMETADAAVLEALLDEILTPERLTDLTGRLLTRARSIRETPDAGRAALERHLTEAEAAMARLTSAIAAGGDIPALIEAVKVQEAQRKAIVRRLEVLRRPSGLVFDDALERRLRAAVGEWRDALGSQVAQARQVVEKLLTGRLTVEPETRGGRRRFRFKGVGTVTKLVAGVIPAEALEGLQAVASPSIPSWNQIAGFLDSMRQLRDSIGLAA
jgi:DNA invertase Pin-like site-specific DNA recombinase